MTATARQELHCEAMEKAVDDDSQFLTADFPDSADSYYAWDLKPDIC